LIHERRNKALDLTQHREDVVVNTVEPPIDDPELGRFTWDRHHRFWLGGIELPEGNPTYLTIHVGPDERERAVALARETVARLRNAESEARRFAAAELLKDQRPEWARDRPPDVERAVRQMVLNSVAAQANGSMELAYGNDVYFGGVEFIVWFDQDGTLDLLIIDDKWSEAEDAEPGAPDSVADKGS
jgi:hypothetical protein